MSETSSGYSGYALASALSGMKRYGMEIGNTSERVFSVQPLGPPPCEETLPTELIDWPEKK